MTEQHPIIQLEQLIKTIRTRRLSDLDMDQISIAAHLLTNLLVRIDIEKAPAIKAAVEAKFEPGQQVEVLIEHSLPDGMMNSGWQKTTVINKRVLEVHPPAYQYQTAATGRDNWLSAKRLREVIQ